MCLGHFFIPLTLLGSGTVMPRLSEQGIIYAGLGTTKMILASSYAIFAIFQGRECATSATMFLKPQDRHDNRIVISILGRFLVSCLLQERLQYNYFGIVTTIFRQWCGLVGSCRWRHRRVSECFRRMYICIRIYRRLRIYKSTVHTYTPDSGIFHGLKTGQPQAPVAGRPVVATQRSP